MRLAGCLALCAALAWSGLSWLLWRVAGAGEAAVVTISRWLGINPASTQWIAELLALAGGIAQLLVAIVWLAGMALIWVLAWLGHQAMLAGEAADMAARAAAQAGHGPVIEGEVQDRTLE